MSRLHRQILAMFILLSTSSSLAYAQATRTWVSGTGNDANPCSRTQPCQTFAAALVKTNAGGEISVLDPGGFGQVTITKSITLNGEGTLASILAPGTNGIVVNAAPSDVVVIRNLAFEGATTGLNGIHFTGGGKLYVENCTFNGFNAGNGINVEPGQPSTVQLFIKDTVVRNNGGGTGGGIFINPAAGVIVKASLSNVRSEGNIFGLKVQGNSAVFVRDSVFAMNGFSGVTAFAQAGVVTILLDHVSSVNNGTTGVLSNGSNAFVRISNVTVSGNQTGLAPSVGGQILSFGTNNVSGNGTDGSPTGLIPQQ